MGVVAAGALAFAFLVPVVYYAQPAGIYFCPAFGCVFPHYGSLTYWAFGIGGLWTYGCTVGSPCFGGNGYTIVT